MNGKKLWHARQKEYEFLNSSEGQVMYEHFQTLLTALISGWPRRGKTVLVMNPIHPSFAISLWEAGFDVTVQEECPELRSLLHDALGNRAEIIPDFPDALRSDDCSYDYTIVMGAIAFGKQHKKALEEIKRVTCKGVIFLFINKNSITGFSRKKAMQEETLLSPIVFQKELRTVFTKARRQWKSMILLPTALEKSAFAKEKAREILFPFPLGGVVGVRVELGKRRTYTPLVIKQEVPTL